MAIYDLFETTDLPVEDLSKKGEARDCFFSSLTTRVLFFFLLTADILWVLYTLFILFLSGAFNLITASKVEKSRAIFFNSWARLKRGGICAVALLVALFHPALGIMIACIYFLVYDPTGIYEVVPRSFRDQFEEFLKK